MTKELNDILNNSRVSGKELLSLIDILHAQNGNKKPVYYHSKSFSDKVILPHKTFVLMNEAVIKSSELLSELSFSLADTVKKQELEQENAELKRLLEIIEEKGVGIGYLKTCETLAEYNSMCREDEENYTKKLTQEEFDTLRGYFK